MVVEGWLARAAAARPDRVAVQTPSERCSYAELLRAARFGADQLAARGVRVGQRVAIVLPAGLAFAQALHACMLLGAVAVPVDLRASAAERALLADGAVTAIEEPLGEPPAAQRSGEGISERGRQHDLGAVAAVIHSSGTSGLPRAIELSYGNFLWSALGSTVALGLDPNERWLCALPVSHIGGLSILLRSCISATTAIVHERFDTESVLEALGEPGVTLISLVATTLGRLLDGGLSDPPTLRWALTGGGPVPPTLLERARSAGVPVSPTYGLSEACSQVATGGPVLFCTRVRIASDHEILVRGPTIAAGELAADGWLHTGDLGRLDEDGRLHVSGRKTETIISGGENVAPAEVETVLESHPQVLEAAVLGRDDPHWGQALIALVVPRRDASVEEGALRAYCAERLASYKVPKQIRLVGERLPRTRSGKLLRRELA